MYKQLIKQSITVSNVHMCSVVTGKRRSVRSLIAGTESSWFTKRVEQLNLVIKNKQERWVNGAVF